MTVGKGLTPLQQRKQFLETQPKSAMPPVPLARPRKRLTAKDVYHRISWLVFFGCLVTLIIGITHPVPAVDYDNVVGKYVTVPSASPLIFWSIGIFLGYWFIVGMFFYLRTANRHFDAARAPLPTLQEIAAHLRDEGFDPSIADCIALQNQIKMEKIEQGVIAGAMFIGPSLLARQASGKPIL